MKPIFDRVRLFDGSMGALLGSLGYSTPCPDALTVTKPEVILGIHEAYLKAGANVLISDSFGSTEMVLAHKKMAGSSRIFGAAAVALAKKAAAGQALVAADFGPTSEFMYPVGEKTMEDFFETYYIQAVAAKEAGADFGIIETQTDAAECRAACLALRKAGLPAAASFSIGTNGRTLTGSDAECCALILEGAGASALGLNCSCGPKEMLAPLGAMRRVSALPVIVQPNAGLPCTSADGKVTYPYTPEMFREFMKPILGAGASAIGGCCGTTPAHIQALADLAGGALPVSVCDGQARICSLRSSALLSEALGQVEVIGDPEDAYDIDEDTTLVMLDLTGLSPDEARENTVQAAAATRCPLGFRAGASDVEALEAALRVYAGVAAVDASAEAEEILAFYGAKRI